jgi:RNA polymerase sigma-70 factor, ECF subfamily
LEWRLFRFSSLDGLSQREFSGQSVMAELISQRKGSPQKMSSSARANVVTRLPDGVPTALLVERARGRDKDSAAESLLYRRYADDLLCVTTRLLRSPSAAEDVVHDTFMVAFERLEQLRDAAQFRAWALSIAVSLVRKRLRRAKLLQWVGLETLAGEPLELQARDGLSVEARGELAVLDTILRKLPTEHRLAWSLRHIEGEKLESVAASLGKSLATTKRYIAAAEQRISAHVHLETP